jgi:hypothetical protein
MTAAAGWTARTGHSSVALPGGSIVLMGGYDGSYRKDVWRTTDQGATWTIMTSNAGWTGRYLHTSVAQADSSIVLIGGAYIYNYNRYCLEDVWRSIDQGATWTEMSASVPDCDHESVALPDGSIVLTLDDRLNIWRMETAGSTEQHPTHIYAQLGPYSVALQVYNADDFSSMIREAYINVTDTEANLLYLPMTLRNTP